MFECNKKQWGGKRKCAGRKKTCLKKVSFNRRIDENVINILKKYAEDNFITETEALESAILLQYNIYKRNNGGLMKIVIPSSEGKLCGHFGHCDYFSFVEIDTDKNEILSIEEKIPEEGISCQSASWISAQGANIVLAGGMGGRPMQIFAQNGVEVIYGCPELPIKDLVESYIKNTLETGENACGGEGHDHKHCHHHGEGHHCHGHNHEHGESCAHEHTEE